MKTCACGLLNLLCLIASSSTAIIRSPDNHDDVEKGKLEFRKIFKFLMFY